MAWLAALPVLAVPFVPGLVRGGAGPTTTRCRPRTPDGGPRCAAVAPSAVLFVMTLAGGGVVTFLPIERPSGALATAALLVVGRPARGARWPSGVLADRVGHRLLLPGALLWAPPGSSARPAACAPGDALVLAGAALFGVGYGAVQNLTLAAFARAGDGRGHRRPGAMWNAIVRRGHRDRRARAGRGRRRARAAPDLRAGRAALLLALPCRAGLARRPGGQPRTRSAVARSERMKLHLLGAAAQPGAQPGRVAAAGRRAADRAAPGGCRPGRAAPGGSCRASARAMAVSAGADEDRGRGRR